LVEFSLAKLGVNQGRKVTGLNYFKMAGLLLSAKENIMKKILLLASALFALSAQVNAASTNLIVNGSFEDPNIRAGSWDVFDAVTGWSTLGAGVEVRDNKVGTAYDGDQFVELDSHNQAKSGTNSSIVQNVANTIAGQSYLLSFAYSPRINKPSTTNGISVFWNGALLDSVTGTGSSSNIWNIFEYIVLGTGDDTLKFTAIGTDDTLGGNLDAVSVSAVPIPAAAFLFGPAFLGLMGFRRKLRA